MKRGKGAPPKGKKLSVGGKMKPLFGRTNQRPEPDDYPGVAGAMGPKKQKLTKRRRAALEKRPI